MNWKKGLLALIFLVLCLSCCSPPRDLESAPAPPELLSQTFWMHIDGDWQHPPADEHTADYRSAPATLIRFAEDHEFSLIHCWIFDGEKLEISNGDGQVIYLGTWTLEGTDIVTKFRLVYERVQPVGGGRYPGPEERALAILQGDKVQFRGEEFQAVPNLDFSEYEPFVSRQRSKLETANP